MTRQRSTDPHHHTPHASSEDSRKAIELSAEENADLCTGCVKCCTYITIEVDKPRQSWEYDQWIWTIDHQGIEMYLERPETWYVHVDTPCGHLQDDGRCAIYGRHPVLCREYDPRECERRLPLTDIVAWFKNGAELATWLAERRPTHYERLVAHRGGAAPGWPGGPKAAAVSEKRTAGPLAQIIPLAALGHPRPAPKKARSRTANGSAPRGAGNGSARVMRRKANRRSPSGASSTRR